MQTRLVSRVPNVKRLMALLRHQLVSMLGCLPVHLRLRPYCLLYVRPLSAVYLRRSKHHVHVHSVSVSGMEFTLNMEVNVQLESFAGNVFATADIWFSNEQNIFVSKGVCPNIPRTTTLSQQHRNAKKDAQRSACVVLVIFLMSNEIVCSHITSSSFLCRYCIRWSANAHRHFRPKLT